MKPTILLAALLSTGGAHAAGNCDSIREQIDAKVRATGVSRFTLTVVDAASTAPGRNVGSCDRGSKKILYVQDGKPEAAASPAPAPPASSPAKPPPKREGVLTECKDGTVSVGGDCKKP